MDGEYSRARYLIFKCGASIWEDNGPELGLLNMMGIDSDWHPAMDISDPKPFDYELIRYLLQRGVGVSRNRLGIYPRWYQPYYAMRSECQAATLAVLCVAHRSRKHRDVWGIVARQVWDTRCQPKAWGVERHRPGIIAAYQQWVMAICALLCGSLMGFLRLILF
jgi:hypothetical protein